jgi:hypothetical protein
MMPRYWDLYQFVGLFQRTLGLAESSLPRLSRELGYLVKFLDQVGLHELELGFVAAEELGAGIGIERVGHLGLYVAGEV